MFILRQKAFGLMTLYTSYSYPKVTQIASSYRQLNLLMNKWDEYGNCLTGWIIPTDRTLCLTFNCYPWLDLHPRSIIELNQSVVSFRFPTHHPYFSSLSAFALFYFPLVKLRGFRFKGVHSVPFCFGGLSDTFLEADSIYSIDRRKCPWKSNGTSKNAYFLPSQTKNLVVDLVLRSGDQLGNQREQPFGVEAASFCEPVQACTSGRGGLTWTLRYCPPLATRTWSHFLCAHQVDETVEDNCCQGQSSFLCPDYNWTRIEIIKFGLVIYPSGLDKKPWFCPTGY